MFIGKLWRGEYPLVVSYWVFGIVGNILFGIPLLFINQFTLTIGQWILFPIGMGIAVLINVGIWRSAGKYKGLPIWKLLAKTVVILSLVMTAFSLITAVTNLNISSTFKKRGYCFLNVNSMKSYKQIMDLKHKSGLPQ
jgi:hypothetical protein